VLGVMEREQVRRVPITDREGRLVGIIAQADVAMDLDSHEGRHRVAEAVEQISEPGRPSRGRGGEWGGRSGSGSGGGFLGTVRNLAQNVTGGRGPRGGGYSAGGSTGGGNYSGTSGYTGTNQSGGLSNQSDTSGGLDDAAEGERGNG
jgi:hypothetical protein